MTIIRYGWWWWWWPLHQVTEDPWGRSFAQGSPTKKRGSYASKSCFQSWLQNIYKPKTSSMDPNFHFLSTWLCENARVATPWEGAAAGPPMSSSPTSTGSTTSIWKKFKFTGFKRNIHLELELGLCVHLTIIQCRLDLQKTKRSPGSVCGVAQTSGDPKKIFRLWRFRSNDV